MKSSPTPLRIACAATLIFDLLAVTSGSVVVAQVESKPATAPTTTPKPAHNSGDWKPLTNFFGLSSTGGATLKKLDDGTVLASGKNPPKDTYVIVAETDLKKVTGLRLEVLKHDDLPGKGPGRLHNGTFILTRVEVSAAAIGDTKAAQPVVLKNAMADFTQQGHSVLNLIDGKPGPGWAIWDGSTANRRVDLLFDKPVAFDSGVKLTVTLKHESVWEGGNLGRIRMLVTDSAVIGKIDPRAVVTKADVEAVMGRAVDAPTMQNDSTCIYRTLPQHYNVEVSVASGSTAARFQTLRDITARVRGNQNVEGLGDEAYWVPDNYRLSVRKGDVELHITTVLPVKEQTKAGQDAARVQRKEAAITLARKALERIAKGQTTYVVPAVVTPPVAPKESPEVTAAKLIEALAGKNERIRMNAAVQLGALRPVQPKAIEALSKAMNDPNEGVAGIAMQSLGEIGQPAKSAFPSLREIVKTEKAELVMRRHYALIALAKMGEEPDFVAPLIMTALKSEDAQQQISGIAAAAAFKADRARFVTQLLEMLRKKGESPVESMLMTQAAEALSQIAQAGAAATVVPALIDELLSVLPEVHGYSSPKTKTGPGYKATQISNALVRISNSMKDHDPALIPALTALKRRETGVRLNNVGGNQQKPEDIVAGLLPALKHEHPVIRQGAAWAMGDRPGPSRPHLARLVELFDDKQPAVRIAAAEAVLVIDSTNQAAADLLVKSLGDQSETSRIAALDSINALHQVPDAEASIAARGAVPILMAMVRSDRAAERPKAIFALMTIGEPASDAAELLGEVAMNDSAADRRMALFAINRFGPKAMPPLIRMLTHQEAGKRELAAKVIALAIAGELPYLRNDSAAIRKFKTENAKTLRLPGDAGIQALIAATKDTDERVRWRAAIALGEVGPRASLAVPALVEMLKDKTTFVRWDAAWAINEIDPSIAVEERRKATADQPTAVSDKGDRLTLLRIDPPLPAKMPAGERVEVRIAYAVKSADDRAISLWPWLGDKPAQFGHDGLMQCRRGEGEVVDQILGFGPFDRLRFLFGDRFVNPDKFEFELVINGKAEWDALPAAAKAVDTP